MTGRETATLTLAMQMRDLKEILRWMGGRQGAVGDDLQKSARLGERLVLPDLPRGQIR